MKMCSIGLILVGILFGQQEYPVCALHVKDSTWFDSVGEDSLGLNTILFSDVSFSKEKIIGLLNAAEDRNLDVIAGHVRSGSAYRDDILWYCQLHWGLWETEDSSNFLNGCWNGIIVYDSVAHNDTAFVAFADSMSACRILKTKADRSRQYEWDKWFYMISYLKIDSLSMDTLAQNVPICSLYITKRGDTLLTNRVLTVSDFSQANEYNACSLGVYNNYGNTKNLYYGIYWFDNCDLWCDYIETKDRWIDSLVKPPYYYNNILGEITQNYDSCSTLSYYYLLDEPSLSYFTSNAYVMNFLDSAAGHKPGMQVTSYYEPGWYKTYVDSIKPHHLEVNIYPLKGDSCSGGATPKDSGAVFQGQLDALCSQLYEAREAASSSNINFRYLCQAFGQILPDGSTQWHREPTPRELKCMLWLGMAYGAKGLNYFIYPSLGENTWVDSGLVDQSSTPPRHRDSLWLPAQEMNFTLQEIGPTLMELTSDMVFLVSDGIPNDCFIRMGVRSGHWTNCMYNKTIWRGHYV